MTAGRKKERLGDISTRIDADLKHRFDMFLIRKHGLIKGVFALTIEEAIIEHMRRTGTKSAASRPTNLMAQTLSSILTGLQVQESYPLIQVRLLDLVIRESCKYSDPRTITKYRREILRRSEEIRTPGEIFPRYDVTEFADYVGKLA